MTKVWQL